MITTAIAILAVAAVPRPAVFAKYPTFHIPSHRFASTYQTGGRNKLQAWHKVGEFTPNEDVVFVLNGGYFDPASNPIRGVDLVVSKGVELVPYRFDLSRPIFAMGNGKAVIFTGKNGEAYAKLVRYQEAGGYNNAIAGDSKPTKPNEKTLRRIIGIRGQDLVVITLKSATWATCRRVIAEQQLETHIYLDGGSSVFSWKKVPTHIVVLAPKTNLDG